MDRTHDCEAEIDVSVAREKRGVGYASLLIESAAQSAFTESGLSRLHAFIKPANEASVKAFEKANFQRAGTTRVKDREVLHYTRDREMKSSLDR
jgi:RimJ/RimL family protein N-acetyltransferase